MAKSVLLCIILVAALPYICLKLVFSFLYKRKTSQENDCLSVGQVESCDSLVLESGESESGVTERGEREEGENEEGGSERDEREEGENFLLRMCRNGYVRAAGLDARLFSRFRILIFGFGSNSCSRE